MSRHRVETATPQYNPVFRALADTRRREILSLLSDCTSSVDVAELTSRLVAADQDQSLLDVTDEEAEDRRVRLQHVHLPVLEDAGLVTRDAEAGAVRTTDHPAYEDPRFGLLLEAEIDGLDAVLSNLATERRRILLTILRDAQAPITRQDLAREFLRSDETGLAPDSNAVDEVLVSLHHTHLPALADADLVEYDPETDRVTYTGHAALEAVFTIIYEPDDRLVDSYDGFLGGMKAACDKLNQQTGTEAGWPHSWRDPSCG